MDKTMEETQKPESITLTCWHGHGETFSRKDDVGPIRAAWNAGWRVEEIGRGGVNFLTWVCAEHCKNDWLATVFSVEEAEADARGRFKRKSNG